MRTRSGGCLCGAIRYELDGEPFLVGTCHCTNCRKESGSVLVAYAKWPRASFRVDGKTATYGDRHFCPVCGSRLFNLHDADVEIRIGTLDDAPNLLVPMQEGWVKRREHWIEPAEGVPQYEEDPAALNVGGAMAP
jgi:hypothetical protein